MSTRVPQEQTSFFQNWPHIKYMTFAQNCPEYFFGLGYLVFGLSMNMLANANSMIVT